MLENLGLKPADSPESFFVSLLLDTAYMDRGVPGKFKGGEEENAVIYK